MKIKQHLQSSFLSDFAVLRSCTAQEICIGVGCHLKQFGAHHINAYLEWFERLTLAISTVHHILSCIASPYFIERSAMSVVNIFAHIQKRFY